MMVTVPLTDTVVGLYLAITTDLRERICCKRVCNHPRSNTRGKKKIKEICSSFIPISTYFLFYIFRWTNNSVISPRTCPCITLTENVYVHQIIDWPAFRKMRPEIFDKDSPGDSNGEKKAGSKKTVHGAIFIMWTGTLRRLMLSFHFR